MNILVLGWYYSSNLGDAVICDCVAALLRRHVPQANIKVADVSGRSAFPARKKEDLTGMRPLRFRQKLRTAATLLGWDKQLLHETWHLQNNLERVHQAIAGDWDLVVFAGGQLFMDGIALYVSYISHYFEERGVPVIFNACGVGPSISRNIQKELGKALTSPCVQLVSCRDGADRINRWCGSPVAVPTDDAALWADLCYGVEKDPDGVVGLGILYPEALSPRRTAACWRRIIRELDARQIPWKFFSNGKERDMAFARTLLDGRPEAEYLCPAPETPSQLVELIASFRSIIGFRLHSHIIAASLDIPSVALVWDQKIPSFFAAMELDNRCFTIGASGAAVVNALEEAEASPANCQNIIRHRKQARSLLVDTVDGSLKGTL